MKELYSLFLLTLFISTGYSQQQALPLSGFKGVDVFGPFEVELIESDADKVEIDYRGIDSEDVIKETRGGILKLKLRNRHYFDDWDHNYKRSQYMIVKVYYKDLDVVKAQAGAIVTSKARIKSKYLSLESSMGAEVTLSIVSKNLETKTAMGGLLELTGQCEKLEANASMGGVLKASRLESKIVYAKASMGADVIVNVQDELEASATFGASIEYVGGPAVRHTNRIMGGEVSQRATRN